MSLKDGATAMTMAHHVGVTARREAAQNSRSPPRLERYRFLLDEDFCFGTFAPFFRASLSPIAMACFRLFTLRPDPLLSVPFFRRRIADLTVLDADLPYFAIQSVFPRTPSASSE